MALSNRDASAVATPTVETVLPLNGAIEDASARDRSPGAAVVARDASARRVIRALAHSTLFRELVLISAIALALRVIFAHAALGTDPTFALVWGRDILHGASPMFGHPLAPTAHPLPILESTFAVALGEHAAVDAMLAISYWSFGALLVGTFRLGEAAFSPLVAAAAVLLVGSNYETVSVAVGGLLDIQFVALVVWAAVLETRRPKRGTAVLGLLAIAGLLRPEAWALAAAYWVYACRNSDRRLALLVLAPPAGWALMDGIVTGNPAFAFTNARQTGQTTLGLSHVSNSHLFSLAINQVRDATRAPVVLGGALGLLLALRKRSRALPAAGGVLVIVLAVYAVLLGLRLPVPDRMLLLPATMLALFCALAALGWPRSGAGPEQWIWTAIGIGLLSLLIATAPGEFSRLDQLDRDHAGRHTALADLRALRASPPTRAALTSCGRAWVSRLELSGYVAWYLDEPLSRVALSGTNPSARGVYVEIANARAAGPLLGHELPQLLRAFPSTARRVDGNRSWTVYRNGC